MSKEFRFSGGSDDTFGELNSGIDHDDCAQLSMMKFLVKTPAGEGVLVTGQYGVADNTWHIGVSALSEEAPLSDQWSFTTYPSYEGYRNLLIVTAPDDAEISNLNIEEEDEAA